MNATTRTGTRLSLNITGGLAFVSRLDAFSAVRTPVGHCIRLIPPPAYVSVPFEAETRNGRLRRFPRFWRAVRWLARHANA